MRRVGHAPGGRQASWPIRRPSPTKDHHELLARKDVDAVIIGSPDHWHVPLTIDACAAGKDVYVEKPLTHDLAEGAAVIDAQNQHKRIVQVGTQQRSMPHFQKAYEIVKSGQLGDIHKVHLTWNRNTPRWARNNYNIDPHNGRLEAVLGQCPRAAVRRVSLSQLALVLGFWRRHLHRPDGAPHRHRALVSGRRSSGRRPPRSATCSRPRAVGNARHGADAAAVSRREAQVYFEGTFVNARNGAMLEFMGSEATLYLDRGRYEIHPERNKKIEASELVLGSGPRGADFYDLPKGELLHLANWVECIRSRAQAQLPGRSRRRLGLGRPPGESRPAQRPGGALEELRQEKGMTLAASAGAAIHSPVAAVTRSSVSADNWAHA